MSGSASVDERGSPAVASRGSSDPNGQADWCRHPPIQPGSSSAPARGGRRRVPPTSLGVMLSLFPGFLGPDRTRWGAGRDSFKPRDAEETIVSFPSDFFQVNVASRTGGRFAGPGAETVPLPSEHPPELDGPACPVAAGRLGVRPPHAAQRRASSRSLNSSMPDKPAGRPRDHPPAYRDPRRHSRAADHPQLRGALDGKCCGPCSRGEEDLYRRWWSRKGQLVAEAVLEAYGRSEWAPVAETGDIRADLQWSAQRARRFPGRATQRPWCRPWHPPRRPPARPMAKICIQQLSAPQVAGIMTRLRQGGRGSTTRSARRSRPGCRRGCVDRNVALPCLHAPGHRRYQKGTIRRAPRRDPRGYLNCSLRHQSEGPPPGLGY